MRKKIYKLLRIGIFLVVIAALFSGLFFGTVQNINAEESRGIDLILVMDQSNSMFTDSDPTGLRFVAAKLILDMLSVDVSESNNKMGLVIFGDPGEAETVFPLTKLNEKNNDLLKQKIDSVKNKDLWYTDIMNGLQVAYDDMKKGHTDNNKPVFVILTDGQPYLKGDWDKEKENYMNKLKTEIIPKFKEQNWPLFTVALGMDAIKNQSQRKFYSNFWNDLSTSTDGLYFEVYNKDDLIPRFIEMISYLMNRNVDIKKNVAVSGTSEFSWVLNPKFVESVSFVITKESPNIEVSIIRPTGKIVNKNSPGVKFSTNDSSETYSVKVNSDDVDNTSSSIGKWIVKLKGKGKATIAIVPNSKLKLLLDNPSIGQVIPVNSKTHFVAHFALNDAVLSEPNSSISVKVMHKGILFKEVSLYDDGRHDDGTAQDGYFGSESLSFPKSEEYLLEIDGVIDSTPVKTTQSISVHNVPSIKISTDSNSVLIGHPVKITCSLVIQDKTPPLDVLNSCSPIALTVYPPKGNSPIVLQGNKTSEGTYTFTFTPTSIGRYEIKAASKVFGSPIKNSAEISVNGNISISLTLRKTSVLQDDKVEIDAKASGDSIPSDILNSLIFLGTLKDPDGNTTSISPLNVSNEEAHFVITDTKKPGIYIFTVLATNQNVGLKASKTSQFEVIPKKLSISTAEKKITVIVNSKVPSKIILTTKLNTGKDKMLTVSMSDLTSESDAGLKIPSKMISFDKNKITVKSGNSSSEIGIFIHRGKNAPKIHRGIYKGTLIFKSENDPDLTIIPEGVPVTLNVKNPTPWWYYLLFALLLFLVGGGGYFYYTERKKPILEGELVRLDTEGNETGEVEELDGRKKVTIGNSPRADISVENDDVKPSIFCIIEGFVSGDAVKCIVRKINKQVNILLNNTEIDDRAVLSDGDVLSVEGEKFRYRGGDLSDNSGEFEFDDEIDDVDENIEDEFDDEI